MIYTDLQSFKLVALPTHMHRCYEVFDVHHCTMVDVYSPVKDRFLVVISSVTKWTDGD